MTWTSFDWYILGVIILLTVCSILTRCSYMLFGDRFPLSDGVRRALRYAPVAALIAIIVPELLPWRAQTGIVLDARVVAAVIATLLFLRTGSTLVVILGGMLALWVTRFLFGFVGF